MGAPASAQSSKAAGHRRCFGTGGDSAAPAGSCQEPQRALDRQPDHVVEAPTAKLFHEAVGALLDRITARLVAPLAAFDVRLDLAGRLVLYCYECCFGIGEFDG